MSLSRPTPTPRGSSTSRGAVLGAVALGGLTYGFTAWPGRGGTDPIVLASLAIGVLGLAAFVVNEGRSRHPMLPLGVFRSRTFSATNIVTFAVYAALGGVFFLVVVNLQVVAGYPPLKAGISLLPITILMLLLSARSGALATRIGPRIPMTVGPLVCRCRPGAALARRCRRDVRHRCAAGRCDPRARAV